MARPQPEPIPTVASERTAWPRYRDNLARHLIGVARDVQLRVMEHLVAACDHRDLRPSFGVLISLVARAPRPLGELARALAISPQATSQLVALAERAGYLARESDPADRRLCWPKLTPAGERLVEDGFASIRAIEVEQAAQVGEADHRRFLAALDRLVRSLDLFPGSDGERAGARSAASAKSAARTDANTDAPGETGPHRGSAGLLPILAAHVEQTLMRSTTGRGHAGLKLSHSQILTLIGPSGARLHRLAELHGVSRQAISATARDLESQGYLRREADPADRRGVVVRLTARGEALIVDSVSALDDLERDWRKRIDAPEFEVFARVARSLYAALELETAILSDAFDPFDALAAAEAGDRAGRARSGADSGSVAVSVARAADAAGPDTDEALARLAARLRERLGSRDAARLAAHLRPA